MQIDLSKTEPISKMDFYFLKTILFEIKRKKPFTSAIDALEYFRKKDSKRPIRILSNTLEKLPGTGHQELDVWIQIVAHLVK